MNLSKIGKFMVVLGLVLSLSGVGWGAQLMLAKAQDKLRIVQRRSRSAHVIQ